MNPEKIKKALPYLIAIPIFYLATLSLFYPELLGNKTLRQTDIVQFEGMKRFSKLYSQEHDETALWNVGMFSGFPEFLMAGVPDRGIRILQHITGGFLPSDSSAHVFFRFTFCTWVMLMCFRLNPYLSIIGALLFAFNTYAIVTLEAGHFTKLWAIAYACLVIGGMKLVFDKKYLLGLGIFLAGLALELAANHYQITYYLIIVCTIYGISELVFAIREKQLVPFAKMAGILLLGMSIGAATQVARLWMTAEYSKYSTRGQRELPAEEGERSSNEGLDKSYAFSWSQGKAETLTLLVPYLYGGSSNEVPQKDSEFIGAIERLAGRQQARQMLRSGQGMLPLYHGDQPFTSGPVYAGAITVFLFVLSLFLLPNRERIGSSVAILLTMAVSWGDNLAWFNYLLFDYIPGFNKFRSPSMALNLSVMLMLLSGMLGIREFIKRKKEEEAKKALFISSGITAGLCLLIALGAGMFIDVSSAQDANIAQRMFGTKDQRVIRMLTNAFEEDRLSLARSDAFRSFTFITLAAALLFVVRTGKLSWQMGLVAIGLLAIIDVWFVNNRYLYPDKFVSERKQKRERQPSAADKRIRQDQDPHYRVLDFNNTYNQAFTSYFHKTIGGYFAAKLGRYQDLIERRLKPEQQQFIQRLRDGQPTFEGLPALNMLNAKYFKFGDKAQDVMLNPQALGHGWFVEELKPVTSPLEEIQTLGKINPENTAVIDASKFTVENKSFEVDSTASIELTHFDNRRVAYKTQNTNAGLAVFSEVYYPDWEATLDGEPIDIKRVNYVLRALEIPAGEHEIEFEFKPESYFVGAPITKYASYATTVILFVTLGFAGFKEVKE